MNNINPITPTPINQINIIINQTPITPILYQYISMTYSILLNQPISKTASSL
jgi:hypothetical protein